MLELIRIAVTLFIITLIGNWLEPHVAAGHYWALAVVVGAALLLAYVIGTPQDKAEIKALPRSAVVWFLCLPVNCVSRLRSYLSRA